MWWSRRQIVAVTAALLLAGCGFRPLYGEGAGGAPAPVAAELARVAIPTIPDRIGQMVRNELIDRLTPHGEPAAPAYTLSVGLNRTVEDQLIRRDATASRARLTLRAGYRLMRGEALVLEGAARSVVSFDLPAEAYFAAVTSERDAERQAAVAVAEQIRTRLATHFARAVGNR